MSTPEPPAPTPSATTCAIHEMMPERIAAMQRALDEYEPGTFATDRYTRLHVLACNILNSFAHEMGVRGPVPPASAPTAAPEPERICNCGQPWSAHYDTGRGRRYCTDPSATAHGHEPPTFTAVFAGAPCACGHEEAVHCPTVNGRPLPPGRCFRVDCDCEQYTPAIAAAATAEPEANELRLLRRYNEQLDNQLTAQATELAALRARVEEQTTLLRRVEFWHDSSTRPFPPRLYAAISEELSRAALAPRQTTGDEHG